MGPMERLNLKSELNFHENLFSYKISEVLLYKKMSIVQLSDIIGKSKGTISNWKHRKGFPSVSDIKLIAKVTNMSIEYFFDSNIKPFDADLLIREQNKKDAMTHLKNSVLADMKEVSELRKNIASRIMTIPEEFLPFIEKLLDATEKELIKDSFDSYH